MAQMDHYSIPSHQLLVVDLDRIRMPNQLLVYQSFWSILHGMKEMHDVLPVNVNCMIGGGHSVNMCTDWMGF